MNLVRHFAVGDIHRHVWRAAVGAVLTKGGSLILVVALMMAVTFLPRALLINTEHWPPFVARALEYLPVAIVAAISLTPLIKDQHLQLDRPEF